MLKVGWCGGEPGAPIHLPPSNGPCSNPPNHRHPSCPTLKPPSAPQTRAAPLKTRPQTPKSPPFQKGFGWDSAGDLVYPFRPTNRQQRPRDPSAPPGGASDLQQDSAASAAAAEATARALTGLAAKTWFAGTELDGPRGPDGKYVKGWHWGAMPYSVRRDQPEWYMKELERYKY